MFLPPPEFFGVTIFALTPHVRFVCFPPPEFLGVVRFELFLCFLPPEFLGVGRFELTPGSFESFFVPPKFRCVGFRCVRFQFILSSSSKNLRCAITVLSGPGVGPTPHGRG